MAYGYEPQITGYGYQPTDFSSALTAQSPKAAQGGMTMDPVSAGVMAGGSFLSQYMAQRAAEEAERKKALMQAELAKGENDQNYAQNQNQALNSLMGAYRSALLGG